MSTSAPAASSAVRSSAAASSSSSVASSASSSSQQSSARSSASSGTSAAATSSRSAAASSSSSSVSTSAISSSSASASSSSSVSSAVSSTSRTSSVSSTTTSGSIISSNNDPATTSKKTGLSSGAIGGIVGGVVGVLALLLLVWFIRKWRSRRRDKAMYPLPAPRADMAYAGGTVTRDEKPGLATSKSYGSYNALHAPSLPAYYANYNRPVSSFNHGFDLEASPTAPQAPYMNSTSNSSPSSTSQYLQPMSTSSSMALNAVTGPDDTLSSSTSGRPLPAPIQTEGLAPPASVMEPGNNVSRRSSRSTMRFPQHMPHSPSMTSMHSGFNNTPHGGRRITLVMPVPLDPNTSTDGYMHSRTNSISEFGQYLGGNSPVSTMKSRARDSRRSLQPYHQGHLSPHFPSAAEEIATIPGGSVTGPRHQQSSSISTITAPSSGPSRSGSGSAGSTTGGGMSDSEALMITTAKGKQVDRS